MSVNPIDVMRTPCEVPDEGLTIFHKMELGAILPDRHVRGHVSQRHLAQDI
jgi:hypothetical protein